MASFSSEIVKWFAGKITPEVKLKDSEVQLSGSIVELQSMDIEDRPDYTTITEPTSFTLLNSNLDTWVTDGSADWVAI